MPDQLTERARKAAEEIAKSLGDGLDLDITLDGREMSVNSSSFTTTDGFVNDIAAIIERHIQEYFGDFWKAANEDAAASREYLEQIKRKIFAEDVPCPKS